MRSAVFVNGHFRIGTNASQNYAFMVKFHHETSKRNFGGIEPPNF
jgi:hypothetical protein